VEHNVPATQDGVANTFALVKPQDGGHEVLAMVANRNLGTRADAGEVSTNIVANASNVFGAGSSFKIFTTAAALEQGTVGFNTDLSNPYSACFTPPLTNRYTHCYPVQNDGTSYPNPISLQKALATSPNVAFVNIEQKTGMQAVLRMAQRLGLRNTLQTNVAGGVPITDPGDPLARDPRYNEPQSDYFRNLLSFTLGVSPVSTLEMSNVAATLVDGGRWCPPSPVLSMTDRNGHPVALRQQPCEQVVSTGLANTLLAGLSQDTKDGTSAAAAKAAHWDHQDIGKTGTTNSSESVAFVGAVDGYAASSMLFADGRRPRELCPGPPVHLGDCGHGAFGGTVAAPPYFQAMSQILGSQPDQPIPGPDPEYLEAGPHGPVAPYVVGQPTDAARQALSKANYPVTLSPQPSGAPPGQVVGQSPQGNVPSGTRITLYTSTGIAPNPRQ
jgi:membrane peptidoglycan carboxypeptidase